MEAKEITITYDTLFEVLKREKDKVELQKLETEFFNNFVDYLKDKSKVFEKDDSLFSADEKKKAEKQIDNAKRLIKEIYERREKKIMDIALIKSRTKSEVMDKSAFLEHEKRLFNSAVKVLDEFRGNVVDNISSGNYAGGIRNIAEQEAEKEKENSTKLVRFLQPVPKFVGTELEEYGPFEEEDIANLPSEIAVLLITKGRVEEIKGK